MRQIHSHNAYGTHALKITANPPQFRGMPSHQYLIEGFDTTENSAVRSGGYVPRFRNLSIVFETDQSNPDRPDGVSMDAVLAILCDHLNGIQSGPNASQGKQMALEYIESARQLLIEDAQVMQHDNMSRFNNTRSSGEIRYAQTGTL
ncbi:hypothetical protein LUCX_115 [Xanthomonas phage vB_XciM_LucasX]|nr:hypothetical protein LUCX_115 [Xanthomonas phage vB_XciM_LucasX]